MIRPGRTPRPEAACHSADVLTPTERAAAKHDRPDVPRETPRPGLRWGDVPAIRAVLDLLRSCQR